jgi:phosphatidylserine/phosphatidylglycerophosphate/cardiolipin synthase-like enzyme
VRDALRLAVARGVRVRVLLDPTQDLDGSSLAALVQAGAPARHYRVNQATGQLLHAKLGIFDGARVIVGSANWSRLGLEVNHELDVLCDCIDVARPLEARFGLDWADAA